MVRRLQRDGYTVDVPPNPLQGLAYDPAYLADFLHTISGPIVLVGHSYGGAVITNAATGDTQVKALVYVDAFAPAQGQTIGQMLTRLRLRRSYPNLPDQPKITIEPNRIARPIIIQRREKGWASFHSPVRNPQTLRLGHPGAHGPSDSGAEFLSFGVARRRKQKYCWPTARPSKSTARKAGPPLAEGNSTSSDSCGTGKRKSPGLKRRRS